MRDSTRLKLASLGALLASSLVACEGVDHQVGSAPGGYSAGGATAGTAQTPNGGSERGGDGDAALGRGAGRGGDAGRGGVAGTLAAFGGDGGAAVARGGAGAGGVVRGGAGTGAATGDGSGGGSGTGGGGTSGSGTLVAGRGGTGGAVGLPECVDTESPVVATGCITDETGAVTGVSAGTVVTVTALDQGDPIPSVCELGPGPSREVVLRAADDREWHYFVALPSLPDDFVQVGDELDLLAREGIVDVYRMIQTVVLGHNGELVVFTVNSQDPRPPDLSAYGLELAVGEPYCNVQTSCTAVPHVVEEYREFVVTQGTDEHHLRAGDTQQLTGVSISVQEVSATPMAGNCDPAPGWNRYGGFGTAR